MADTSDDKLLESLLLIQEKQKLEYSVHIENKSFGLNEASIIKSSTPVNRPTQRGGVYFSNTHVYKIKGIVHDATIIPLLSKTMLGPNTEFGEILVKTSATIESSRVDFSLYANLTNTIQSSSKIELNLTIVRAEKNDF